MTSPSADAFRALARSSPWGWRTLRFTVRWRGTHPDPPVRAWLRRPVDLRVEPLEGGPASIVRERPVVVHVNDWDGRSWERIDPRPGDDAFPTAVLRPDGLVAERPWEGAVEYNAPRYQNYFWVAMLDPVELADGDEGPGTVVEDVTEVDHAGRRAWEAVLRATEDYHPRCACCSLLRTRNADLDWWPKAELERYPEAYRVRLDVGTGVCVLTEAVGGEPMPVTGHEIRIEAVDEAMDDALFRS